MTTKKMTKAQVRVRIAKDVIAQLEDGLLTSPSSSGYHTMPPALLEKGKKNPDMQVCSLIKSKPCAVCAAGALLVAGVRRYNGLKFREWQYEHTYSLTARWFSFDQISLIESAFEAWGETLTAANFGRVHNCAGDSREARERRMVAIMQNIIKNKGTFKP